MNLEQAIQFITVHLNNATMKGAFNLQDASNISLALQTIKNQINITKDLVSYNGGWITKDIHDFLINNKISLETKEQRVGEIKTHEGVDNKAKYDLLQVSKKEN